jgi:acetyl esterase/lipase
MTRFWIAFIFLLSCAGSVRAAFTSVTNLRYQTGTQVRQVLDIHRPAPVPSSPMPVILWIHGGGWLVGHKDDAPQINEITNAGYVLAAMNYRYSSTAPFPAQIQDVKAAIRFLRANAAAYNLDPSRISVWGQSAGAHLAALAAVTSGVSQTTLGQPFDVGANLSFSSAVQACVAFATPSYLGDAAVNDTTVSTYLGGLLPGALPTAQAANCYNPAYLGNDPPFLVVHGLTDTLVPPIYGSNLHNALVAAGGSSTYVPLPGVGHTPWATSEYPRALAFLQSMLATRWHSGCEHRRHGWHCQRAQVCLQPRAERRIAHDPKRRHDRSSHWHQLERTQRAAALWIDEFGQSARPHLSPTQSQHRSRHRLRGAVVRRLHHLDAADARWHE